ncbi:MAG: cytochrome C [Bdellovibrionales bacterium]
MMKLILSVMLMLFSAASALADDFTKEDVARWQKEFDTVAKYGRELWTNSAKVKIGTNGVACAQCHPNGANTHPETYPKFQKQLGKVTTIFEMINWCIRNPLQGTNLAADSKEMIALQAYIAAERKGIKLAPGKH